MYYARALRILGIEDGAVLTRTGLRRIYLRKLKSHPPEKDPDGFRELREAFELVSERVADDPKPEPRAVMAVIVDAAENAAPEAPVFQAPNASAGNAPPNDVPHAETPQSTAASPTIEVPRSTAPPRPPLPPLAPREIESPLAALVTKLFALLAAGHVDAARALERDWRAKQIGDDHRDAAGLLAAKWSLLRELLGVAADLPVPVTKLIAKALAEGDLAGARLSLIVYGREHAIEAELAADVLAKRAPNIFKPIENTLYVPRPKPVMPVPGGVFGYGLDFMRAMADKNKRR